MLKTKKPLLSEFSLEDPKEHMGYIQPTRGAKVQLANGSQVKQCETLNVLKS